MRDQNGYRSVKGEMVVGFTNDGKMYSTPFKEHDPNYVGLSHEDKTRERYVVTFKEHEDGKLVVNSLTRDDAYTDEIKAAFARGEATERDVEYHVKPEGKEIHGMLLKEGHEITMVDPDKAGDYQAQREFDEMRADFSQSQEAFGEKIPVTVDMNEMVVTQSRQQWSERVHGEDDRDIHQPTREFEQSM